MLFIDDDMVSANILKFDRVISGFAKIIAYILSTKKYIPPISIILSDRGCYPRMRPEQLQSGFLREICAIIGNDGNEFTSFRTPDCGNFEESRGWSAGRADTTLLSEILQYRCRSWKSRLVNCV